MNPLKQAIFAEVRKNNGESRLLTDEELNILLFHHPDGLRLSLAGFTLLRKIFTVYSFEIPPTVRSRHRGALGKMEYPYYFTSKRLILFSDADAMMIKLQGGVHQFLENYSQFEL